MKTTNSTELFKRARKSIPGGVNSPVRAFRSVDMEPLFIASATGATVTDVDGNTFVDYVGSWGPMILGHALPDVVTAVKTAAESGLSFGAPCEYEVRMAELLTRITPVEMVRMVNSGTEAVMAALRLARGYTERNKIVKFAGCYHGHTDSMLVKAGSGALTGGVPDSAGVSPDVVAHTLTAEYNSLESVEQAFMEHPREIAAVIVEPVAANMGVVLPRAGFLAGLRELCDAYGALLIFDEVITGFRLAPGGAQQFFGIEADLVTYGKIIGGGMPVGAYGGRREIMECVAPNGPVYQAGTLSGNPVAMAAGLAQLLILADNHNLYANLAHACEKLANGLREAAAAAGIPAQVNQNSSLCCCFFSQEPVFDYTSAKNADTQMYARFFAGMLERGIYLAPSQFEAMFVGAAHTDALVEQTIAAAADTFRSMA